MKRAGTSLIELMIALVVLAAFASTMTLLIVNNSKSDESNDARREARGVARSAITILESELRMAEPERRAHADRRFDDHLPPAVRLRAGVRQYGR